MITTKQAFRPVIKNFKRRKILVKTINDIWGIDLADYSKDYPSGYIMVFVDYFTRFMQCVILKTKTKHEIDMALDSLLVGKTYWPGKIHSDREAGIVHSDYLKQFKGKIDLYHTEFIGSPICERAIRTLKGIIAKLMYQKELDQGSKRNIYWTHFVKEATDLYNNSIHRIIKMKPIDAWSIQYEEDIPLKLREINMNMPEPARKPLLHVGDHVLIAREKKKFEKGYTVSWNSTKHPITSVIHADVPMYVVNGKHYYHQQLQKI